MHLALTKQFDKGDAFPTELKDDECTLGYYGVSDGSEILMSEIDHWSFSMDEAKKRERHQRRVSEQEQEVSARQQLQKGMRKQGLL